MTTRNSLRKSLKEARSSLPETERWQMALAASRSLQTHPLFRRARTIGIYFAVGAECPTLPLSVEATQSGKQLYYPTVGARTKGRMEFVRVDESTQWCRGPYRIPQPVPESAEDYQSARFLDLVIMPLVGFDSTGNRLGMGAGFYDRSFAFRRFRQHWRRPLLIGLAYECQRVDTIPAEPWDVPLDGVATENGLQLFR